MGSFRFLLDEIAGIIKLGTEEEYEDDFDPEEALPEDDFQKLHFARLQPSVENRQRYFVVE